MKILLQCILVSVLWVSLIAEDCEDWNLEDEFLPNYEKTMDILNSVTFEEEYSITIKNCSTGEPIEHDYTITEKSDLLWEKRHQVYDKYYDDIKDCQNCGNYPTKDAFENCMIAVRLYMGRDVGVMVKIPLKQHLKQVQEEELKKCQQQRL